MDGRSPYISSFRLLAHRPTAMIADICLGQYLKRQSDSSPLSKPLVPLSTFLVDKPYSPSFGGSLKFIKCNYLTQKEKYSSKNNCRFFIVILTFISNSIHGDYTKKLMHYTLPPWCYLRGHILILILYDYPENLMYHWLYFWLRP